MKWVYCLSNAWECYSIINGQQTSWEPLAYPILHWQPVAGNHRRGAQVSHLQVIVAGRYPTHNQDFREYTDKKWKKILPLIRKTDIAQIKFCMLQTTQNTSTLPTCSLPLYTSSSTSSRGSSSVTHTLRRKRLSLLHREDCLHQRSPTRLYRVQYFWANQTPTGLLVFGPFANSTLPTSQPSSSVTPLILRRKPDQIRRPSEWVQFCERDGENSAFQVGHG